MNNKPIYYEPPEERISTKPQQGVRESDSRIIIDRLLRQAGWDIEDKNQVAIFTLKNSD